MIIIAVGCYLQYNLSYYEVQELLYDIRINVSHATIHRWVGCINNKLLETTDNFYPLKKMLYQNLTRTRGKIEVVIIENRSIFNEICGLVDSL